MEQEIIKKLKLGDEKAFKFIYDTHYVLLCRFATQLLHDPCLAEEVVDDAIFYLWEHRKDIEISHSIRAYLMRAVRNACLNELRSQAHQKEISFSSFQLPENIDFLDAIFVEDQHPLGVLLDQELEHELTKSIGELSQECGVVFKKSRFEHKKYEEIAEELDISVNTVKYHIKNAISFLEKRMSGYLKWLVFFIFL